MPPTTVSKMDVLSASSSSFTANYTGTLAPHAVMRSPACQTADCISAFLGVETKCARCHDSPAHTSKQEQVFALAALLETKAAKINVGGELVPLNDAYAGLVGRVAGAGGRRLGGFRQACGWLVHLGALAHGRSGSGASAGATLRRIALSA